MLRLGDTEDEPSEFILVENWADEFMGRWGTEAHPKSGNPLATTRKRRDAPPPERPAHYRSVVSSAI